ncbi:MAG TPA: hypothetical protein VEL76_24880 [Gemmataceae bacterium]|nr:hypothetical protein [Gemmataceae bacterium]
MTEAEWLTCTGPGQMLAFLRGKASGRKLRLFACAGCRRIWHLLLDERSRQAVEAAERFADGEIDVVMLASARAAAWLVRTDAGEAAICASAPDPMMTFMYAANKAAAVAAHACLASAAWVNLMRQGWADYCDVLRDLFGNPFRRVSVPPAWLAWNGGTVRQLAMAAHEERNCSATLDATRLAVLADALEEAGCNSTELLGHLRGPGQHYRGCWGVDTLLGKS